jgi:hypothetical protein
MHGAPRRHDDRTGRAATEKVLAHRTPDEAGAAQHRNTSR